MHTRTLRLYADAHTYAHTHTHTHTSCVGLLKASARGSTAIGHSLTASNNNIPAWHSVLWRQRRMFRRWIWTTDWLALCCPLFRRSRTSGRTCDQWFQKAAAASATSGRERWDQQRQWRPRSPEAARSRCSGAARWWQSAPDEVSTSGCRDKTQQRTRAESRRPSRNTSPNICRCSSGTKSTGKLSTYEQIWQGRRAA